MNTDTRLLVSIGTFAALFAFVKVLYLPEIAVMLMEPNAPMGLSMAWNAVFSVLMPAIGAYATMMSKYGDLMVMGVSRFHPKQSQEEQIIDLAETFAPRSQTHKALASLDRRLRSTTATVNAIQNELER